jgi:hypothetical protein
MAITNKLSDKSVSNIYDWSCSVHRHVSQEVKSISQLLENDDGTIVLRSGLGIKGSAITPKKKPRVPTMSERDLTRSHTARHWQASNLARMGKQHTQLHLFLLRAHGNYPAINCSTYSTQNKSNIWDVWTYTIQQNVYITSSSTSTGIPCSNMRLKACTIHITVNTSCTTLLHTCVRQHGLLI